MNTALSRLFCHPAARVVSGVVACPARRCVPRQCGLKRAWRRPGRGDVGQPTATTCSASGPADGAAWWPEKRASGRKDGPIRDDTRSTRTNNGLFWLLVLNMGVFVLDHVLRLQGVHLLYLHHARPQWWQFVTYAFCHWNYEHICRNTFLLYIFGKTVEDEEGTFALWATYIVTALGASLASFMFMPTATISLGASGAVFGLFAVAVLCKLQLKAEKLLEAAILGQFVLRQLASELAAQAALTKGRGVALAGVQIGHLAHLAGAAAGVLLVYAISRLPAQEEPQASRP